MLALIHPVPAVRGAKLQEQFASPNVTPRGIASGVWRYGAIVHPNGIPVMVSHPEGNTPLICRDEIATWSGVDSLMLKHEGHNPTGSFKDRGMTVAVTQAVRIGARAVVCASTGNTAAALAAYAAQANLKALVLVPEGQVTSGKMAQSLAYGATVIRVRGDFDACMSVVERAASSHGVYLANSINPFRIEGQKTIVLEMLQQLEWQAPNWIVFPAGNLGNTTAFAKALIEAVEWGLISSLPRLAAVQASGAAPFAAAYQRGFDQLIPVTANTVASAIRIGAPASYSRAVAAIRATNGVVLACSDAEIMAAKRTIDRAGVGCEPASAAAVAGVKALLDAGIIKPGEKVIAVLTGHLLKDIDTLKLAGDDAPSEVVDASGVDGAFDRALRSN
jgi:threonine synthase